MTTPMTSRDIVKSVKQPKPYWEINKSYTNNQMFDYALECVEASQAQQASVIAELVEAMLSASPIIDTITIDRTEYEAMKADAERWRYFRETASEEMCYALCGNSNAENEELDQAIDQARKI